MGNAQKVFKKARLTSRKAIDMKKAKFEEFKAGRKTYLVFPLQTHKDFMAEAAMERFHCTREHLRRTTGYVLGEDLYLLNPHLKRQKTVTVVYFLR